MFSEFLSNQITNNFIVRLVIYLNCSSPDNSTVPFNIRTFQGNLPLLQSKLLNCYIFSALYEDKDFQHLGTTTERSFALISQRKHRGGGG